jgi:hypothetical protein
MKNDPTIKTQEKFIYTTQYLEEMKEWDVTLMDGLKNEPVYYVEDEWDNIHGDMFHF